mgnify:CR=1 FL=1
MYFPSKSVIFGFYEGYGEGKDISKNFAKSRSFPGGHGY